MKAKRMRKNGTYFLESNSVWKLEEIVREKIFWRFVWRIFLRRKAQNVQKLDETRLGIWRHLGQHFKTREKNFQNLNQFLKILKKFQACQLFFTGKTEIIIEIDLYQVRAVVQNKRFLDIGEFKEKKWVIRHLWFCHFANLKKNRSLWRLRWAV